VGIGFKALEPNMLDSSKGTVIGAYRMGENERLRSTWFHLLKVGGTVVSSSGGLNSNQPELFNIKYGDKGRCKCAKKGKKDAGSCTCKRK